MRYWTSDLHLGHKNISEYCPDRQNLVADYKQMSFDGSVVHAMNEALIESWNSVVEPYDNVIIVGDLCMGKIEESLSLVPRLNGYKSLVPGNHDRMWSHNRKQNKDWVSIYNCVGIEILPEQFSVLLGNLVVEVCHFPYKGDSQDEDRYLEARPVDRGRILLCGHVHDSWIISGRQINVGVDVWEYKPVSDAQLLNVIGMIEP
jgi:calcineurin-like phosphoesterase family protein